MKRSELIRELLRQGCVLLRPGGRHDIYLNPTNGQKQPVPRHTEIDNALAKHIKKYLGINAVPMLIEQNQLVTRLMVDFLAFSS